MSDLAQSRTSARWSKLLQSGPRSMAAGYDIKALGLFFLGSGCLDLVWIMSYPEYAMKVFGTTFGGWAGAFVKYQHPVIHWIIGYGFFYTRRWAYRGYLAYLGVACLSEIINQVVFGFNSTRTTMIILSLIFGTYIVFRKNTFV